MSTLLTFNTVVFGLLVVIWTKSNWLNFFIKALFLGLLVANAMALAKI